MDFNKLIQLVYTLKYIRFSQLYYQVKYILHKSKKNIYINNIPKVNIIPNLRSFIENKNSYNYSYNYNEFIFLNRKQKFKTIDWNFNNYGKLWTYNLNYFDFLNQENLDIETGLKLMIDYCKSSFILKDGLEPYPISLRTINWIKFISKYKINNETINLRLYNDYLILLSKLEYHIQANHILENAYSLFFGAHYFRNLEWLEKSENLLNKELIEQILPDGAHYELSPMYHKIILLRNLDCYNLAISNNFCSENIIKILYNTSSKMISWLNAISFNNDEVPLVNDSSLEITPENYILRDYASSLQIKFSNIKLKESGYRKLNHLNFEVLFDVGQIAPSYQPGHSHADNLNVLLNYNNEKVIVDMGISTYEKNQIRQIERSSVSHNVVTYNNLNSSDVWSGFRVGKRARTEIIKETTSEIEATHDGYKTKGIHIKRKLKKTENGIQIIDSSNATKSKLIGRFHFHPNTTLELSNNQITVNKKIIITFTDIESILISEYNWCKEFNVNELASKLEYTFINKCYIDITTKNENIISY